MTYVKNADLTKCYIVRLINRCEYKDTTSTVQCSRLNVEIK